MSSVTSHTILYLFTYLRSGSHVVVVINMDMSLALLLDRV